MANDTKGSVAFVVPVFRVEAVRLGLCDVPLRIGRIRVGASSHAECAVDVGEIGVVFERNGLSRPPLPHEGLVARYRPMVLHVGSPDCVTKSLMARWKKTPS